MTPTPAIRDIHLAERDARLLRRIAQGSASARRRARRARGRLVRRIAAELARDAEGGAE